MRFLLLISDEINENWTRQKGWRKALYRWWWEFEDDDDDVEDDDDGKQALYSAVGFGGYSSAQSYIRDIILAVVYSTAIMITVITVYIYIYIYTKCQNQNFFNRKKLAYNNGTNNLPVLLLRQQK